MDNPKDRLLNALDVGLKTLTGVLEAGGRAHPGAGLTDSVNGADRDHLIGLMRVNHTGEVCAQALYAGQGLFARTPSTRAQMQHSADEEVDHLVWCQDVLNEQGGRASHLNPLFFAASFGLGAAAALINDETSLAFVHATEENVEAHLEEHLTTLPVGAERSRAIIQQMQADEVAHGQAALAEGGTALPRPIRRAMKHIAGVMTYSAYRI